MSECDEEEEHDDWEEHEDWEDPEELPLVIAGKSFTELLEDQLLHDGEGGVREYTRSGGVE